MTFDENTLRSSALMSCPVDGISLEDEQKTTDILLKSDRISEAV